MSTRRDRERNRQRRRQVLARKIGRGMDGLLAMQSMAAWFAANEHRLTAAFARMRPMLEYAFHAHLFPGMFGAGVGYRLGGKGRPPRGRKYRTAASSDDHVDR